MAAPLKIAVFASGSGSNAENIAKYFQKKRTAKLALIVCNNAKAGVHTRAARLRIPVVKIGKHSFTNPDLLVETLKSEQIELIVLAGFLKLIPKELISAFPNRILNIHPALLPRFGGKGMYGKRVHQAVVDAGQKKSGITVHLVSEEYDEGQILEQVEVAIDDSDGAKEVEAKIRALEIEHFPKIIEEYLEILKYS